MADLPEKGETFIEKHKGKLIGAAVGVTVGAVALPVGLLAAGFGAGGIVAGSAAAGIQSAVYGGATTGLFSIFQSFGAAGVPAAITGKTLLELTKCLLLSD